jgi:hypothetical protein
LRARDFPTERVLSRTPLIIRTVDQIANSLKFKLQIAVCRVPCDVDVDYIISARSALAERLLKDLEFNWR